MIDPPKDAHEAFDQFEALTRAIAEGGALVRSHAVVWSQARDALLASAYRDRLPGFAFQCLSVFKYREFILLYHPDPQQRRAFIDQLLEPARRIRGEAAQHERRPPGQARPAAPDQPRPGRDSREWML